MEWLITYVASNDKNAPQHTATINAGDYTKAYIKFICSNNGIILEIKKI